MIFCLLASLFKSSTLSCLLIFYLLTEELVLPLSLFWFGNKYSGSRYKTHFCVGMHTVFCIIAIHTIIHEYMLRPNSIFFIAVGSVVDPPWGAEPRFELGPAL